MTECNDAAVPAAGRILVITRGIDEHLARATGRAA